MSTSFCPQYISFKMNGLMGKLDNLLIHNKPNRKWVRFRGTPCSKVFWPQSNLIFPRLAISIALPKTSISKRLKL